MATVTVYEYEQGEWVPYGPPPIHYEWEPYYGGCNEDDVCRLWADLRAYPGCSWAVRQPYIGVICTETQSIWGGINCTTKDYWALLGRMNYAFDLSNIGASSTITSGTFSVKCAAAYDRPFGDMHLHLVSGNLWCGTTETLNSDTSPLWSSFSAGSYKDYTLNAAGIANVTCGGTSYYGMRVDGDLSPYTQPSWAASERQYLTRGAPGTSEGAKLTLTGTIYWYQDTIIGVYDIQGQLNIDTIIGKYDILEESYTDVTLYPINDGYVERTASKEYWTDIRTGAGTGANQTDTTARHRITASGNAKYSMLRRGLISFDMRPYTFSVLSSITAAALTIRGTGKADTGSKAPQLGVGARNPSDPTNYVAADYGLEAGPHSNYIAYSSYNTSGDNVFTYDANGRAYLKGRGGNYYTACLTSDYDINNVDPNMTSGQDFYFEWSTVEGTQDPKLDFTIYRLLITNEIIGVHDILPRPQIRQGNCGMGSTNVMQV